MRIEGQPSAAAMPIGIREGHFLRGGPLSVSILIAFRSLHAIKNQRNYLSKASPSAHMSKRLFCPLCHSFQSPYEQFIRTYKGLRRKMTFHPQKLGMKNEGSISTCGAADYKKVRRSVGPSFIGGEGRSRKRNFCKPLRHKPQRL